MSREMRFRAWDYTHAKMNYDVLPLGDLACTVCSVKDPMGYVDTGLYKEPNHSDVMQFSGLKDKNDVDLYEGDICWDDHREYHGQVVFEDGAFRYHWDNVNELLDDCDLSIEVVGHIFENKDLLK